MFSFAGVVLLGAAAWLWLFEDLPAWDSLPERLHTPSVRIVDRHGRLLYEALDEQGGRNAVVPIGAVPQACRLAAIATEDRRFYSHPGVDLRGVLRAVWINLRGGETLAGGSTITQQVARNLLLDEAERGERSLRRKLREAFLAWRLTRHYSKDEILALYLNQTYYGGMAYGIEAAAQTFFGKPVAQLDLAECALLAGLPQAPARYNPFTDLAAARHRQSVVLRLMEQDGYITAEQRQLGRTAKRSFWPRHLTRSKRPHFVMMVRAELDRLFTEQEIYRHGGLVVRTTLDLDWQRLAEAAVRHHLEELQHSESWAGSQRQQRRPGCAGSSQRRGPGAGGQPGLFRCRARRRDQHGAGSAPARLGHQAAGLCRCLRSCWSRRRLDGRRRCCWT